MCVGYYYIFWVDACWDISFSVVSPWSCGDLCGVCGERVLFLFADLDLYLLQGYWRGSDWFLVYISGKEQQLGKGIVLHYTICFDDSDLDLSHKPPYFKNTICYKV